MGALEKATNGPVAGAKVGAAIRMGAWFGMGPGSEIGMNECTGAGAGPSVAAAVSPANQSTFFCPVCIVTVTWRMRV